MIATALLSTVVGVLTLNFSTVPGVPVELIWKVPPSVSLATVTPLSWRFRMLPVEVELLTVSAYGVASVPPVIVVEPALVTASRVVPLVSKV
jgi:hypothetical protein